MLKTSFLVEPTVEAKVEPTRFCVFSAHFY
uniref:Uncharacterized protein n=1 Tax=Myoviridae sp. ct9MV2 TaxID=2826625 RepID=A0A8S5ND53_9CAUD|nr:MAG TPA: hypothetical protein [Myoviridae sp. ct9MV2]